MTELYIIAASLDGYPYTFVRSQGDRWPQYTKKSPWAQAHPHNPIFSPVCEIFLNICFPASIPSASEAFRWVAFVKPECGDCSEYSTWMCSLMAVRVLITSLDLCSHSGSCRGQWESWPQCFLASPRSSILRASTISTPRAERHRIPTYPII